MKDTGTLPANASDRQTGRADEELRRQERVFRAAFMGNPDACCVLDVDMNGVLCEINDGFERIFGYSRAESLGRTTAELDLWHPAQYEVAIRMLLLSGGIHGVEENMRKRDGARFDASVTATLLEMDGKSYACVIIKDLTSYNRVVQAMRAGEQQHRALIDLLPLGLVVLRENRVLLANRAAASMFGFRAPEHAIGQSFMRYVHPDDQKQISECMRSALTTGGVIPRPGVPMLRQKLLRNTGDVFTADVAGCPIVFDGATAVLAILIDVTEHLATEAANALLTQQLRQSQKMEAVGRLAGGVAHDFNNLLTVITGHAELATLKLPKDDPLRPELEEIDRNAQRAAGLTRQLLAFSRKQVLDPVVLNLNETVTSMNRMLRRIIGERIRLETSTSEDPWHIKADPGQIEQVIVNLAVNARDAMPEGGTLAIETMNVLVDETLASRLPDLALGPYVLLSVIDTGMGMTPDVQARIFEPFFTTKPPGEGTGLGLSTVYGIVMQSGGHIFVHSEVGGGTTFSIYFPRVPDETTATDEETAGPRLTGCESILLVEDNASVRATMARVLAQYGYRVTAAAGAEAACSLCERVLRPPDLLVADVILPEMTGVDLTNWMRRKWSGTRVLLISGYTAEAIPSTVTELGLDLLQKPFGPVRLITKIREVLDR